MLAPAEPPPMQPLPDEAGPSWSCQLTPFPKAPICTSPIMKLICTKKVYATPTWSSLFRRSPCSCVPGPAMPCPSSCPLLLPLPLRFALALGLAFCHCPEPVADLSFHVWSCSRRAKGQGPFCPCPLLVPLALGLALPFAHSTALSCYNLPGRMHQYCLSLESLSTAALLLP